MGKPRPTVVRPVEFLDARLAAERITALGGYGAPGQGEYVPFAFGGFHDGRMARFLQGPGRVETAGQERT